MPIEEPLTQYQGPINSNIHVHAGYRKHKSSAKISRGYERAQEFHQVFSEVPKCDTEDTGCSTFDSGIKDLESGTKEKASQSNSCNLTDVHCQTQSSELHLSETENKSNNAQQSQVQQQSPPASEMTETNNCLSENPSCDLSKIMSMPNMPECGDMPLLTKTLTERQKDQYFDARHNFHSLFHNKKDLESMIYFACLYKIFDPCVHLKAANIYGVT